MSARHNRDTASERLPRDTEVIVQPGNREGVITTPVRDSGSYHVKLAGGHTAWIAERNVTRADDKERGRR